MPPLPSRPIVYSDGNACLADWFLWPDSAAAVSDGRWRDTLYPSRHTRWEGVGCGIGETWHYFILSKSDVNYVFMFSTFSHTHTLLPFKSSMSSSPPSTTNRTQSSRFRLGFTSSLKLKREDVNKRSEKFLPVCYEIWIILKYQFIKNIYLEN